MSLGPIVRHPPDTDSRQCSSPPSQDHVPHSRRAPQSSQIPLYSKFIELIHTVSSGSFVFFNTFVFFYQYFPSVLFCFSLSAQLKLKTMGPPALLYQPSKRDTKVSQCKRQNHRNFTMFRLIIHFHLDCNILQISFDTQGENHRWSEISKIGIYQRRTRLMKSSSIGIFPFVVLYICSIIFW